MSQTPDQGERPQKPAGCRLLTESGKPLKVLSTSLGVALLAGAVFVPAGTGHTASASAEEPQLVEWSTDEVKAYFDPNTDWSIPLPAEEEETEQTETGAVSSGGTTVINNYGGYHSGFGWDDLLLYHFLFNRGSAYSSRDWYDTRPTYYGGTSRRYSAPTYSTGSFQNKQVTGSVVKPKTSTSTTGSITRRGNAKAGGIGGTSSGFGSSGSSSSSKSSSSGSSSSSKSSSGKSFFGG